LSAFLLRTFAALKYYNYRLWFAGQLVSLFGTWMQSTAQGYLIFELTQSPAYLGYVGFANGLPTWLFMLYGGLAADRMPRRTVLALTQTAMMVLAFILATLTFTGRVQPWHIVLLAFGLGTANAFDAPSRQAFVLELVGREDLTNAIALNSTMFNTATVLGPALAGLTYALYGPAWCFVINGLSFIAVIAALLWMRIQPHPPVLRQGPASREIRVGFRYAAGHPAIRTLILNMGMVSLFGLGFITLMPAWSVDVLGGDATTNGLLFSARGFGALSAALMIAALGRIKFKGRLLTIGSFVMPLILILFSTTRLLPLSMLALVGIGWGFMVLANMSNALIQTNVPDELRGRVMSIYMLAFFGLMPAGSLINGVLASRFGAPATVLVNGSIMLAFAALVWLRFPIVRALE
jgi:MFS family permease